MKDDKRVSELIKEIQSLGRGGLVYQRTERMNNAERKRIRKFYNVSDEQLELAEQASQFVFDQVLGVADLVSGNGLDGLFRMEEHHTQWNIKYMKEDLDKYNQAKELSEEFRTLSKEHHPDIGGDDEIMKQVNSWYEQSKKDVKRTGSYAPFVVDSKKL